MAQHSSVKAVPLSVLMLKHKKEISCNSNGDSGKALDSFRPIVIRIGALDDRKGSAYVEFGNTKVICSIDGPKEPTKNADFEAAEGQIRVFLKNTTHTTNPSTSVPNSSTKEGNSGIRNALESALRSVICLELFSKAQIDVEITVLDDDGGVLAVSLIAASLALIDSGIQVYDICLAAHIVVLADGRIIVDPSAATTSSLIASTTFPTNDSEIKFHPGKTHLSVTVGVMPSLNQIACCEFVGIALPDQLKHAITVAVQNSFKLYPLVRKTLISR